MVGNLMNLEVFDGSLETLSHWRSVGVKENVIAVDFHHTITTHCSACAGNDISDPHTNGAPQKDAALYMGKLQDLGFKLMVFTGSGAFWDAEKLETIPEYLDFHNIPYDYIRYDKPPSAFIIDDRNVHHLSWYSSFQEILRRMSMNLPYSNR